MTVNTLRQSTHAEIRQHHLSHGGLTATIRDGRVVLKASKGNYREGGHVSDYRTFTQADGSRHVFRVANHQAA